jgi:AmmeMemoRadiSam system protein A
VSPAAEFSTEQRRVLLGVAHRAILAVLEHGSRSNIQLEAAPAAPALAQPRGVFATLYVDGNLRGCVGYAAPVAPLYRAVAETACAAAFDDARFAPVTRDEALKLEVSLSVLSRVFPIAPSAVEVGRHGLIVSQGNRRGLLLPQVPVEHGWDRETFLEQACRKAGLPEDSWKQGAILEAFTAEVFCDGDEQG